MRILCKVQSSFRSNKANCVTDNGKQWLESSESCAGSILVWHSKPQVVSCRQNMGSRVVRETRWPPPSYKARSEKTAVSSPHSPTTEKNAYRHLPSTCHGKGKRKKQGIRVLWDTMGMSESYGSKAKGHAFQECNRTVIYFELVSLLLYWSSCHYVM